MSVFSIYMETLQISDERLDIAVRAAEEAGSAALSVKHTTTQERKHNNTIVTEADREAERIVRTILESESSYPILGEEQGGDVEDEDSYWVVDPIDGTTNFSYTQPIYGTAVAFVEDGEPAVGAFYMPEFDYLFYAVRGEGAYRNQEPLSVTNQTALDQSYFTVSGKGTENFYNGLAQMSPWAQELGCAVAGEGWVASGWCDVGVFGALAPWDMAVGVVLIREAGGVIKTVNDGKTEWDEIQGGKVIFGPEDLVETVRDNLSSDIVEAILESEYNY